MTSKGERRPNLRKYFFIAAILQVVWGFVPSASKFVIEEIPVELYIAIRWTISGAIFALFLMVTKRWQKCTPRSFILVSLLGILGYGAASLGTLYGLKVGGVTNFALMSALNPIITSIVSIYVLKERPLRSFYIALPLSVSGLCILAFGKYQISSIEIAGLSTALIVGAAILEAFVFVYSKKFKEEMSAAQYIAIAQISAASLMWILQGTIFHQTSEFAHLTLRGMLAAVFVSVVACVLCYAVLYWLLNYIDGHRLALFDSFHALSA